MNKKLALLTILCLFCGCADNSKTSVNTDISDNCTGLPACDGNSKVICRDGSQVKEPCGELQTCLNGDCVPGSNCTAGTAGYCNGNQAVSCVGGWLSYDDCAYGCNDGECLTQTCDGDSRFPY